MYTFLSKLTDLNYRLYGLTVIFVPNQGLDVSVEIASKDKDLVKRFEGLVVYWTRQIRTGLQDQDQNTSENLFCPMDEFEFWIYRCEPSIFLSLLAASRQICFR